MVGLLSGALTVAGGAGKGGFKAVGEIASDKIKSAAQKVRDENIARLNDKYAEKQEGRRFANRTKEIEQSDTLSRERDDINFENRLDLFDAEGKRENVRSRVAEDKADKRYQRGIDEDEKTYNRRRLKSIEDAVTNANTVADIQLNLQKAMYQFENENPSLESYGKTYALIRKGIADDITFEGDVDEKTTEIVNRIYDKKEDKGGGGGKNLDDFDAINAELDAMGDADGTTITGGDKSKGSGLLASGTPEETEFDGILASEESSSAEETLNVWTGGKQAIHHTFRDITPEPVKKAVSELGVMPKHWEALTNQVADVGGFAIDEFLAKPYDEVKRLIKSYLDYSDDARAEFLKK